MRLLETQVLILALPLINWKILSNLFISLGIYFFLCKISECREPSRSLPDHILGIIFYESISLSVIVEVNS